MQDKKPYNEQRQRHGYWEIYHDNGQLHCKGSFLNGKQIGQHFIYWSNGKILGVSNYINGKLHGYHNFNCGKYSETTYHAI